MFCINILLGSEDDFDMRDEVLLMLLLGVLFEGGWVDLILVWLWSWVLVDGDDGLGVFVFVCVCVDVVGVV